MYGRSRDYFELDLQRFCKQYLCVTLQSNGFPEDEPIMRPRTKKRRSVKKPSAASSKEDVDVPGKVAKLHNCQHGVRLFPWYSLQRQFTIGPVSHLRASVVS
jgi:hypothetical protein